jgi:outer membrane receptor for ferrienterochelin and colicins
MNQHFLKAFSFYLLFTIQAAIAQRVCISGKVSDLENDTPIVDVNVYIMGTTLGTVTNAEGVFKIDNVKSGNYEVVFSSLGYRWESDSLSFNRDTVISFKLKKSNLNLGEIVVTGTLTPHHVKNVPVQTEVVSQKMIQQVSPSSFTDLMSNVSPSFDFSPSSMGAFMQLNGLGNDYILILVDGQRLYGDVGGQTNLNRINPENIDHIEIVKGASSALYGSEAIAGVINIITRKPANMISFSNSSRVGSYGGWNQMNDLSLNIRRFSSATSFNKKQTDGWQLFPYELDGNDSLISTDAMVQNASSDFTISQKFSYNVSQKLSIQAQGTVFEQDWKRPLTISKYGYFYNDLNYSAGAKYLLNNKNFIQINYCSDNYKYYYKYNQDYKEFSTGLNVIQTSQLGSWIDFKGYFNFNNKNILTTGAEYVNENLESEGRLVATDVSAYMFSLFAQDEIYLLKKIAIVAGTRFIRHKEFRNAFTPKIAVMYKYKNINVRTTFAKGFKNPSLKELYYHYEKSGILYLGNTSLNPQISNYYAFSSEYNAGSVFVSITGYHNSINNLIDYKLVETSAEDAAEGVKTTKQYCNISKAATQGIDFIFNYNIFKCINLGGGYSFVDARNITGQTRLENVAENYGNVRLGYTHQWTNYTLCANITDRVQDEKYYEDGNAKGFNLWNFSISLKYDPKKLFKADLTCGLENVFDYSENGPYGTNYGTITPGRTWFVSLNISLFH